MQLTEDERAALDDFRDDARAWPDGVAESVTTLCEAMLRLFPIRTYGNLVIRWDDEITPERLVACGGSKYGDDYIVFCGSDLELSFWCETGRWDIEDRRSGSGVGHRHSCWRVFRPRNMGEVWQLMERCGIEEAVVFNRNFTLVCEDDNVCLEHNRPDAGTLGWLDTTVKTRGEFRALCRLLGVTLKDEKS